MIEAPAIWAPNVEMKEQDGELIIRADLPGLAKDDVKVEVAPDAITLEGERKKTHEETNAGYYRSEVTYGSFYRYLPLPEGVQPDTAKATFKDGVLEVRIQAPKRQVPEPKRLEIA